MVKVNATRPSLRRRQDPNPHVVLLGIFLFIIVGLLFFTYTLSIETTSGTKSLLSLQQSKTLQSVDRQKAVPSGAAQTIAYAVSITGCGSDPLSEGAAVLKHAIHLMSVQGNSKARYDYRMYAIVHPDAVSCGMTLEELGYTILKRDTPVAVKDIQGEYLRSKIEQNGCCGEKELIKLEAYTLVDHPVVVHLDLDTLVLKPLDDLFDIMLGKAADTSKLDVMWKDIPIPEQVNAFLTRDYNMVNPSTEYKPAQGGFLVLRPSMETYRAYVDIIRVGDFREHNGWGGKVGPFYGAMTFQGLIPYYYDYLHPGTAVELNRCVYNQMCDNPRDKRTINDIVNGDCRTGEKECEDCRSRPLEDVVTTHFTLCQKPWWCLPQNDDRIQERLCRKLHAQWYRIRSELEKSWGRSGQGPGTFDSEHFHGYCKKHGHHGYIPIARPFNQNVAY
ncbi:hypothetical protein MHU86_14922 [Fragilaria crotonensis]|nr:hypothetical protein MHU86_14922 [Fragilaria crotonensis]